jgi:putative hydrolase of the HAD superfamily
VLIHPWGFRDSLARDYGITPDMTDAFFKGPFVECAEGRADLLDVLPAFLTSWRWTRSASDFLAEWLSVENDPDEAVLELVAELRGRGMRCYVASTQECYRARYLAHDMRFEDLFDGLFFSSDLGVAKPKANFFTAIADRLGHPGEEILFIDDAPANVEGARSAGWRAEQFTSLGRLRSAVARHTGLELGGA